MPRDDVHVGIQLKREPTELVRGDAQRARWTLDVDVIEHPDGVDFRGPAVQGRRGERFVYLTWGNVGDDGTFAGFRRAKLMLADVIPFLEDGQQRLIATVDLTDSRGGPSCARLKAPALAWSVPSR